MTESGNWYDYPQYFDLAFRDETPAEIAFFQAAFERYAEGPVKRIYEPGCGSGRLVVGLAAAGFEVTGLDLNRPSLAYLRRKLRRRGLTATTACGDMIRYRTPSAVDAAICTFNTFRHLTEEAEAIDHLRAVADCVRPGGIYILGFHIIPLDADEECTERWRAHHGRTSVSITLRVLDFDRRRRLEQIRVSLLARSETRTAHGRTGGAVGSLATSPTTRTRTVRCRTDYAMRLYTTDQVRELLAQVPSWECVAAHDFDYQIDAPRELDDDLTDAVLVLRRRGGGKSADGR